jgi:rhodanese-related sulfurtransferase
MRELPDRIDELEPYRDQPIVVYCRSGARSGQVVRYLQSMGFSKAMNLKGGTNAWSRDVDPSLPTY